VIQPHATGGQFHAVQFYKDSTILCDVVARFFVEGFAASQPAVAIATPEHAQLIQQRLQAMGHSPAALLARQDLLLLDADQMLGQIVVDGMPRARRFRTAISPLLERASAGRRHRSVRAFGEMVDVLWKAGRPAAALKLEMYWNQLARRHDFSLLCGYAIGNTYRNAIVEYICGQHTHVIGQRMAPSLN
jgi:hypothetical protein